jgi:hypothetical protein
VQLDRVTSGQSRALSAYEVGWSPTLRATICPIPKLIVRVRLRVNVRVKPGVSPMAGAGSHRQTGLIQLEQHDEAVANARVLIPARPLGLAVNQPG